MTPTTADEAEPVVLALLDDLRASRERARDAERRVSGLTKMIDGYVLLYPHLADLVNDYTGNPPPKRTETT